MKTSKLSHYSLAAAALTTCLAFAGCHSNTPAPIVNSDGTATTANGAVDPADANMAAGTGTTQSTAPTQVLGQSTSYAPQQQAEQYQPQQQAAPVQQNYSQGTNQNYDYQNPPSDDNEQPVYAEQAPPPLPEYDQPPAPDPNYLWTPGYWAYGSGGYYWVPGAWSQPPYYGALWTPPYWGYYGNHYRYYHGYWGPHVGYYGGVDYGFGYIGVGFFGGYWNGPHFYYNSSVTRLRPGWGYAYSRPVVYGGRSYGFQPSIRISFNGGRGGLNNRPQPFEVAAMRERHEGPTNFQRENHEAAMRNPGNSFNSNRGRPAMAVAARPLGNVSAIRETPAGINPGRPGMNGRPAEGPGARPGQPANEMNRPGQPAGGAMRPGEANRPGEAMRPGGAMRPGQPTNEMTRPGQPATQPGVRPGEMNRPGVQPNQPGNMTRPGVQPNQPGNGRPGEANGNRPGQPATQPGNIMRPGGNNPGNMTRPSNNNPGQQARPTAPVTRQEPAARPAPTMQGRPAQPVQQRPMQENRPQPQPQQARPQPQPQQARPQPAARPAPEARPAPQARPQPAARPAPAPAPAQHTEGGHPGNEHR